jgi:hypothetical protein
MKFLRDEELGFVSGGAINIDIYDFHGAFVHRVSVNKKPLVNLVIRAKDGVISKEIQP